MQDRELVALVEQEFANSMGAPDAEISKERAEAYDYYLSKPLGNEQKGASQVVTSDVADVVDSIMPSLLRLFTTADNLVSFDAVGPEDEAAAAQESDYVTHVFFKENPAFEIMYTWFFCALVQKNGIVKAWWDESERVTTENYQNLTENELAELLADPELEAVEQEEEVITIDDVDVSTFNVTFRRVSGDGNVCIEAVPPEEYRISSDSRSLDPSKARMVGHETEKTRSELVEMGFDKNLVASLPSTQNVLESDEEIARKDRTDDTRGDAQDPSQELVRVREAYCRIDYDGDGKAELRQIIIAGNQVMSNEPIDRQPFHVISPQPLPFKHFGRATAEKVMDVQKVQSTLVRQILDNLYHTNNPGHAVWEQGIGDHTLDDLLTTRVGRVARFERPIAESYSPITVPFTAGSTFPMLDYWDRVKRDRTGISSDGDGLDPEALKNIQTSVLAQANDLSRMKVEAIARIFAETGIKSLFRHIHELLLKHQRKERVVKLRGQWVPVSPAEWRERSNMTVNIGLGIGSREANLLHLNAIWEKQRDMAANGGMNLTVTPRNIFHTAAEIVKNANLPSAEMFFTDPGNAPAPPPGGEQQQLMQMQAQLQARQQQLDMERAALDREKMERQHQREMIDLQRKQEETNNRFTVEMEKIATKLTELDLQHRDVDVPGSVA